VLDHVVITGASSGIGAALARHYATSGRRLSLIARNRHRLKLVADDCISRGADAAAFDLDVTDAKTLAQILLDCERLRPIDLLIANAGIGGSDTLAPATGESNHVAGQIIAINTLGVINTVTPLLPIFVNRGHGRIVIISSLAAMIDLPSSPAYCASKAAARAYGLALRRLLLPSGVGICVVCPGFVATPMSDGLPFTLPFLWTADRAASHIARHVERGRSEILFPWQLAIAVRGLHLLPTRVVDRLLRYATKVISSPSPR
jgi:short-subunit dehydrogenase